MDIKKELISSIKTSMIDKKIYSIEKLQPSFVYNDYQLGTKVINTIIEELNNCDEFIISVAFITNSGITILLNTLQELERKGIRGRILTSNYLNFNEVSALRRLKEFTNVELKVCTKNNFHSKGYIFRKDDKYTIVIGSSNLTQNALTLNSEWNLKFTSLQNGKLSYDILNEFESLWDETAQLTEAWLDEYESMEHNNYQKVLQSVFEGIQTSKIITPNKMQAEALLSLAEVRSKGDTKALVVSATGTGKTYLAAFDVKQFKPKRLLFVIHREQIAREAKRSFKRILGDNIKAGILSGRNKDITDIDFVFSTIQTLSKRETLERFPKDYFDYICIDEVHRAGASSYLRIIEYFEPKFMLGMSATPERTDGFNIYELFDYNIAYEIRLQKALAESMLTPFHYFGVTELILNGEELSEESDFRYLVSEERVNHILEKIDFYGYSGSRVKGLIFCSRVEECRILSELFNEKGFQTTYLSGEHTQEQREDAIEKLQAPFRTDDALDYIFSVDVFNEGVDIPKVNQIVMLRPTESAIIFVQQLGRGLRLDSEKEYVVVIDFIANYKKNFLIPVALSGDRTYNKDALRRFISSGSSIIPGASTINFDRISEQKIFASIDRTNFARLTFLREEYFNFKNKINRIPSLADFYNYGTIDPQIIFAYSKSYYNFLKRVEGDNIANLDQEQIIVLEYISQEVANAKRVHEIIILKHLLTNKSLSFDEFRILLESDLKLTYRKDDLDSAINLLTSEFQIARKQLNKPLIVVSNNTIYKSSSFNSMLENEYFYSNVRDLIEYSLLKFTDEYSQPEKDSNLVLYRKYSRKDVLRILNWEKDESATVYGYRIKYNTCPIFITYDKSDDIDELIKYEDEFIDHSIFSWMTKHNRRISSNEVQSIIHAKENGVKLHMFIKKNDDEGIEHYYLGEVETIDGEWSETTITDNKGKQIPIVNFLFRFKTPVRDDIFDYFKKERIINEENN